MKYSLLIVVHVQQVLEARLHLRKRLEKFWRKHAAVSIQDHLVCLIRFICRFEVSASYTSTRETIWAAMLISSPLSPSG